MAKKRGRKRRPWNKGIEVGPKDALTPNQVKRVRQTLARRGDRGLGDLTLFSLAIDTMLQGPELLGLTVKDVERSDGTIRSVIEVARPRGRPPVRCALSKATANALGKWIAASGKRRTDHLFSSGRAGPNHPMTVRQMNRRLKFWLAEAGLNPKKYGKESLRRTKAIYILNGTGDVEAVRMLLGHTKIESTVRYLRIAAKRTDPIVISRAFEL
jgi:integrase